MWCGVHKRHQYLLTSTTQNAVNISPKHHHAATYLSHELVQQFVDSLWMFLHDLVSSLGCCVT